MQTILSEKFNNPTFEKPAQSKSEDSNEKPKEKINKLNQKQDNPKKLYIINENSETYPQGSFLKNINPQTFSNESQLPNNQNQIVNNTIFLTKSKTDIADLSENIMPITEKTSNSKNDFNFNFDAFQFSSLGEYNQNNNSSNNLTNIGIEIPNFQEDLDYRSEENFYLSNRDIVDIAMSMNDNMNQNANEIFGVNNANNEVQKKDEKNPFEFKDIINNELTDSNNSNQISTKEGNFNFSEYTITNNDVQSNKPDSTNQLQLLFNENELNNIQTISTTDILNDYLKNDFNFNTQSIKEASSFQNDLTNIIQPSTTNVSTELNALSSNGLKQENQIETKDSSTQTESSDLVLNVSLEINPFETKLQNINISSKTQNSKKDDKLEKKQNQAFLESIDTSSKPDSQNQNAALSEFIDTFTLEMPSSFATVSKIQHSEKKKDLPKGESIPKSVPEFNFYNIPIEIQDNNTFVEQNAKIENVPLSQKENNIQGNSLRYSILESSNNKDIDLANIYAIAEAELIEEDKNSSKDLSKY